MIRVKKKFGSRPKGLRVGDSNLQELIKKVLKEGSQHKALSRNYRDPSIEKLLNLYQNKCGYCEIRSDSLEVDHYRPVKRYKGKLCQTHTGYYWLAYEWSNLVLACSRCNKHKSSRFPIGQVREVSPPTLDPSQPRTFVALRADQNHYLNEEPLLLHPELKVPEFRFRPNGKIEKSETRVASTVAICNLNRRTLLLFRQTVFEEFLSRLKEQAASLNEYLQKQGSQDQEQVKQLLLLSFRHAFAAIDLEDASLEFLAWRGWLQKNLGMLLKQRLGMTYAPIVMTAWQFHLAERAQRGLVAMGLPS